MSTILTDDEIDAAWEGPTPSGYGKSRYDIARAVIAAYEAKLAQQEPVAWRYKKEGGGWFVSDNEPQYVEQWNDIEEVQPLYTHPAPQQADRQRVPDDHVLVPVEPTRSMMAAAVIYANGNAVYKNVAAKALEIEESIYGEIYEAMLAAAPEAPAQASAVDERAEFETWVTNQGVALHYEGDGHYGNATVSRWWEAWKARAALAQKGGAA